MAYDEKMKQYTIEYKKAHLKRVPLELRHDEYAEVSEHAHSRGESVNGFIKRAISETMKNDINGRDEIKTILPKRVRDPELIYDVLLPAMVSSRKDAIDIIFWLLRTIK